MERKSRISKLIRKFLKITSDLKNIKTIESFCLYVGNKVNVNFADFSQYKNYDRFLKIRLSNALLNTRLFSDNVFNVIQKRRSRRNFNRKNSLSIKKLSLLLKYGCGCVKEGLRTYPSAGALYPLEVYLFLNKKVSPLNEGLYHYSPNSHTLEKFPYKDILTLKKRFKYAFVQKRLFEKCVIALIITAIPLRSIPKYRARSLRYILLEAGHLAQNILLLAEVLKIKACPIGGFQDTIISSILDLEKIDEFPVYVILLGS